MRHARTRKALAYLIKHEAGLRRYCDDGRLPISNILTEHVAKTVAVARKNFMFCDTTAGAHASALIYSILKKAKANKHNPLHYMNTIAFINEPTDQRSRDCPEQKQQLCWCLKCVVPAREFAPQSVTIVLVADNRRHTKVTAGKTQAAQRRATPLQGDSLESSS